MNLDRHGREFYSLAIDTLPAAPVTAWAASFDGEVTWVAGQAVTGYDDQGAAVAGVGWLLAGPNYDTSLDANPAGTVTLPDAGKVQPHIRLVDSPEVPIRRAPPIYLT